MLSLSFPVGGAGHRPNPFQVAQEASWIGCEGVSWPGVPPGMIVSRTLAHQMLDRLVGAVAVRTDGRVPARDPVKVSCYQWGMTSVYLCHRHALVPGPIPLPTLVMYASGVSVTGRWLVQWLVVVLTRGVAEMHAAPRFWNACVPKLIRRQWDAAVLTEHRKLCCWLYAAFYRQNVQTVCITALLHNH